MYINELAEPTLLVIYPGRFQPFHKGHKAVYDWLTGKFGSNNVYIATSNKTDNLKSPFGFAEKAYFMQLTGVPTNRVVQATQPYQITSIRDDGHLNIPNPSHTVVIFAVSEKDMSEDPRFKSWSKKDGSPAYFQPLKDIKQTESMDKHAYIMTVPTFDFKVMNQPMRSASEIRKLYADSDEATRKKIIADLFGRYTAEAEKIMTSKLAPVGTAQEPKLGNRAKLQKVGAVKNPELAETIKLDPKREQLIVKARAAHPMAKSDEEALALYVNDKEEYDARRLSQDNEREDAEIDAIETLAKELRTRLHSVEKQVGLAEEGGVGVVANKKQARDPRYSMSLTKDVRPGQISKSLKAFNLAEDRLLNESILLALFADLLRQLKLIRPEQFEEWKREQAENVKQEMIALLRHHPNREHIAPLVHQMTARLRDAENTRQFSKALRLMSDFFNQAIDLEEQREPYQQAIDKVEARRIEDINNLLDEIAHRIATENLPKNYVEILKQKIEKLKAERLSYYVK